jgi:hypothetical protein
MDERGKAVPLRCRDGQLKWKNVITQKTTDFKMEVIPAISNHIGI